MAEPRDKHQLARIALRRRRAESIAPSEENGKPSSAPAASGASPGGDDVDGMFDRSFAETFASGPAPEADGEDSTDIPISRATAPVIEVDLADLVDASAGKPAPAATAVSGDAADEFLRTLAANTGVPAIHLDRVTIDLAPLDLVPRDIASRNLILPVFVDDQRIVLAMADPQQRRVIDELEFVSGRRVVPHVAPHSQIRRVIESCYRARAAGEKAFAAAGAVPVGQHETAVVRPPGAAAAESGASSGGAAAGEPIDLDGELTMTPSPIGAVVGERRQKRVLVVDDEADIRLLVVRVLRDKGYEVIEASQGAEALRLVQSQLPDLLVLDAMLPEIHGFDVCRRIKSSPRYAHIPVVMISAIYRGWRFASDLKKSYGVDHFLEKPFKIGELVEKVGQLLTGAPRAPAGARELSATARSELSAGVERYRAGDLEGATQHLQRGVEADPLSHQLHYQLGILYGKQGKLYQAIQELEAALEIEPGDFSTLRGLGQLYEHAGFPCKAVEMWERAASASTDEAARSSIKEHLLKLL